MNTNRILMIAAGLICAAVLALSTPMAQDIPPGQWWANPTVAERLSLTPGQITGIEDIMLSAQERLIDLRAQEQKAKLKMVRLFRVENIDRSAVISAMEDAEKAAYEIAKIENRTKLDVALSLDSKQRELLMSMHDRRSRIDRDRARERRQQMQERNKNR